jgi:prolyl oligopeptidase
MHPLFTVLLLALVILCAAVAGPGEAAGKRSFSYPPAPKSDQVDDYNGVKVADPFRPLEDPDSPETRAWIEAENRLTFDYLRSIPERERIRQRLEKVWNYERFGMPSKFGGRYFYSRNSGLQNQAVLYVTESLGGEGRVLLDPNTLTADGTVALSGTAISDDGRLMAYGLATAGSDWQEWRVRDVDTGRDREDHLRWIKFSGAAWTLDNRGFFYIRYDEPQKGTELQAVNTVRKLCYHRLGTAQSEDVLVYTRPDQPDWFINAGVSEDGRYLIIEISHRSDDHNRIYYKDLKDPLHPAVAPDASPVVELLDAADASYDFVDNNGPVFWIKTTKDAPRGRLIAVDTRQPQPWKPLIPEAAEKLNSIGVVGERFFANYMKDAHTQIRIFDFDGKPLGEVPLPGLGSAGGFGGKRRDRETFFSYTSFTTPTTIYRYDIPSGQATVFKRPQVAFAPDAFETEQVFYRSKDGTRVPMFLVHRKGLKKDGKNPTLLYGYGGFNVSQTPGFSLTNLTWLEMGGVYAVANLRGGGEYGEEWHRAGTKLRKQNVFDDFIAAAEWLIDNGYTSPKKLAIAGGSNGGLLVGACMTQRPELFGAALPAVGVMDMLRFNKFTIGWAWEADYGSPQNPDEFKALRAYSPLHNLKRGTKYPATLVTTSDHDDRVVPAHSFKFAAALQEAQGADRPTLIRIETKAGHGAGKPTAKIIEEIADQHAFLLKALGMKLPGDFGE